MNICLSRRRRADGLEKVVSFLGGIEVGSAADCRELSSGLERFAVAGEAVGYHALSRNLLLLE